MLKSYRNSFPHKQYTDKGHIFHRFCIEGVLFFQLLQVQKINNIEKRHFLVVEALAIV